MSRARALSPSPCLSPSLYLAVSRSRTRACARTESARICARARALSQYPSVQWQLYSIATLGQSVPGMHTRYTHPIPVHSNLKQEYPNRHLHVPQSHSAHIHHTCTTYTAHTPRMHHTCTYTIHHTPQMHIHHTYATQPQCSGACTRVCIHTAMSRPCHGHAAPKMHTR